ncbi:MAG: ADP-ribosylglycohydrolase family protein [Bacteroidota bacterium]
MDISWIRPEQIAEFELLQLADEGIRIEELSDRLQRLKTEHGDLRSLRNSIGKFLNELEEIKPIYNNKYIQEFLDNKGSVPFYSVSADVLRDKILGGWNGRAAGCLLGKPVEKYRRNVIREILESNNSWPLEYYITDKGIPEELLKKYPWNRHSGSESLRENIVCMTEDDDMNYAMLNLHLLEKYGGDFTTDNVADVWLNNMPVLSTFTAERVAYLNLLLLRPINEVPLYRNPYREWIGAMIRADVFGWASPGNPLKAARMAFNDASLSHTRDGIFASMFFAACISLAFVHGDVILILKEALEFIPEDCRIHHAVEYGMSLAQNSADWEEILGYLEEKYSDYFWVHSVNNTALIAAALVYSGGDYSSAITNTVMGGWDTDSDAATVGSVIGTMCGFRGLPGIWISPLNDRIRSSLRGFDNSSLTALAERTLSVLESIRK